MDDTLNLYESKRTIDVSRDAKLSFGSFDLRTHSSLSAGRAACQNTNTDQSLRHLHANSKTSIDNAQTPAIPVLDPESISLEMLITGTKFIFESQRQPSPDADAQVRLMRRSFISIIQNKLLRQGRTTTTTCQCDGLNAPPNIFRPYPGLHRTSKGPHSPTRQISSSYSAQLPIVHLADP